jgi:hypothetical protein
MDEHYQLLKALRYTTIRNRCGLAGLAKQAANAFNFATPSSEHLKGAACYLALQDERNAWTLTHPTGHVAARIISTYTSHVLRQAHISNGLAIKATPRRQLYILLNRYGPAQLKSEIDEELP